MAYLVSFKMFRQFIWLFFSLKKEVLVHSAKSFIVLCGELSSIIMLWSYYDMLLYSFSLLFDFPFYLIIIVVFCF